MLFVSVFEQDVVDYCSGGLKQDVVDYFEQDVVDYCRGGLKQDVVDYCVTLLNKSVMVWSPCLLL